MTDLQKEYAGLQENLERFKNDLTDEKTKLLFSIAYRQGYDKALGLANYVGRSELLAVLVEWLRDNYSIDIPDRVVYEYNRYNC